jgi:hypothetical protein
LFDAARRMDRLRCFHSFATNRNSAKPERTVSIPNMETSLEQLFQISLHKTKAMTITPFFRKFGLTAHIIFSVGWLGAVAGFLALAIAGLTSQDPQMSRSAYITMELIAWFVIVPSNLGALLTGLTQSLGTQWGLFRHYWILVKFFLTIAATIILLLHMQPISYMANIATETTFTTSEFRSLRKKGVMVIVLVLCKLI